MAIDIGSIVHSVIQENVAAVKDQKEETLKRAIDQSKSYLDRLKTNLKDHQDKRKMAMMAMQIKNGR